MFDDNGAVTERVEIRENGLCRGCEIEKGAWHTVGALEPNTVVFEVKPGPYDPSADKHFAPWAPEENAKSAAQIEHWFKTASVGAVIPNLG